MYLDIFMRDMLLHGPYCFRLFVIITLSQLQCYTRTPVWIGVFCA